MTVTSKKTNMLPLT